MLRDHQQMVRWDLLLLTGLSGGIRKDIYDHMDMAGSGLKWALWGAVCFTLYHKFSEIWTTLENWATIIILQNNHLEIWTTLDLSLVAISQSMDNQYFVNIFIKYGPPLNL